MKKTLIALSALSLSIAGVKAGSVTLENFDISAFNVGGAPITSTISAIWGTYSGGVFTPLLSSTQSDDNTGYLDGTGQELSVNFSQTDNTVIAASTPMFVSIYNVAGGAGFSTWSSSAAQIVLSDPSWVAPTFTFSDPSDTWSLTANTIANSFNGGTGTYNYNSGSPHVTLAVPEPSTYAVLALSGLALGGYAMRRRRRA